MSDDLELDKAKARINKLLNLAEKATNEHEAASAAAKARALMDKYQLTQIDILNVDGVEKEFLQMKATRAFNAFPQWMNFLSVAVAKFNDCQSTFEYEIVTFKAHLKRADQQHKYGKYIQFRGMKDDVEMCVEMYQRLINAVNNLCALWLVEIGHVGKYPVKQGSQFKLGAQSAICDVLKAMQIEREKLTFSTGTSLVVVKSNQVAEYFGNVNYGEKKFDIHSDEESINAYQQGRIRGRHVEVVKKVEEK